MSKSVIAIAGIVTIVLAVVLLGFFLFPGQSEDQLSLDPVRGETASPGMGITYLTVTPGLSEYYHLGVDTGALVTEVVPGSPSDRAGVHVGDVILSFNGAGLEEAPLLGMMMACPAGSRVTLEVWREKSVRMVELSHTER